MGVWKRATTPEEKRIIMAGLEDAWNFPPDMRLGQLLVNAMTARQLDNKWPAKPADVLQGLFYIEDEDLLGVITQWVQEKFPPTASTSA